MSEGEELLEAYGIACGYLDAVQYLVRRHIPVEEWPPELAAMCSIDLESFGPKTVSES
jgi:hypothetical protein